MLQENSTLRLRQSIIHVLQLADQTAALVPLLARKPNRQGLQAVVEILSKGHKSCRENMANSSQEIEQVVGILEQLGVDAIMMPFEGWGGGVVALLDSKKVELVIREVQDEFYNRKESKLAVADDLNMYINYTREPTEGVAVLDPSGEIWF